MWLIQLGRSAQWKLPHFLFIKTHTSVSLRASTLHLLVYCKMQYPFPLWLTVSHVASLYPHPPPQLLTLLLISLWGGAEKQLYTEFLFSPTSCLCQPPHIHLQHPAVFFHSTVELSFTSQPSAAARRQATIPSLSEPPLDSTCLYQNHGLSLHVSLCVLWTLSPTYVGQPSHHSKYLREMVCKLERFILSLGFRGLQASREAGCDVA